MTKSGYKYLYEIGRAEEDVRVAAIAKKLGVSEVSVYKGMEKLRRDGYLVSDGSAARPSTNGKKLLSEYGCLIDGVAAYLQTQGGLTETEAIEEATGAVCGLGEKGRQVLKKLLEGNHVENNVED